MDVDNEMRLKFNDYFQNKSQNSEIYVSKIQINYDCCGLDFLSDYRNETGHLVSLFNKLYHDN